MANEMIMDKLDLWFFRDLSEEQRTKLLALIYGIAPTAEMRSMNVQRKFLRAAFTQEAGWMPIEQHDGGAGVWDVWTVRVDELGNSNGDLHQGARFMAGHWHDFGGTPLEWQHDELADGCSHLASRRVTHFRPLPAPPGIDGADQLLADDLAHTLNKPRE